MLIEDHVAQQADNSAGNKRNPDPTKLIKFGPEIMNGNVDFTADKQNLGAR